MQFTNSKHFSIPRDSNHSSIIRTKHYFYLAMEKVVYSSMITLQQDARLRIKETDV